MRVQRLFLCLPLWRRPPTGYATRAIIRIDGTFRLNALRSARVRRASLAPWGLAGSEAVGVDSPAF
jgi:hypothetical protein